jgi:CheY-like chemotaxis protein
MKTIRVLYVDDEKNPLVMAKTFLEELDSEMLVNVLSSPEDALKIIDSYQCIITDFKMPKMDGIEFAQKIREKSDIPIILYTGWGTDELYEKARAVGIDECISKGLEHEHYEVLVNRIKSLIKNRR